MLTITRNPKGDGVTVECFNAILHTMTDAHIDGSPAYITGRCLRFPIVGARGKSVSAEFSWETVARILNTTREFKSQ